VDTDIAQIDTCPREEANSNPLPLTAFSQEQKKRTSECAKPSQALNRARRNPAGGHPLGSDTAMAGTAGAAMLRAAGVVQDTSSSSQPVLDQPVQLQLEIAVVENSGESSNHHEHQHLDRE